MNLRDHITKISDKVRIVKEYGILDKFIDAAKEGANKSKRL